MITPESHAGILRETSYGSTKQDACETALSIVEEKLRKSIGGSVREITENKCDCSETGKATNGDANDNLATNAWQRWECTGWINYK